MPYAWSLVFLSFGPFPKVLLWSTSRIVPSILQRGQPSLIRFLVHCFVSRNFLIFMRYSFLIFFHLFEGVSFQYIASICRFPFSRAFWLQLYLLVWLLPSFVVCNFSLLSWCISLCHILFLFLDSLFSLFVLVFSIFYAFCKKFDVYHVYQELIFSCDLLGL